MSKKYNLSDTQIRHLAIICFREQGSNDAGVRACASHMCNYYEKYQQKNFKSVYECTFGSGWYWEKEVNDQYVKNNPNVPQSVVDAVDSVIRKGERTIPEYVDEYDQLVDIHLIINDGRTYTMQNNKSYVLDRRNYVKDKTIIENRYAKSSYDRYTFFCFPDGVDGKCDAFGYISKPAASAGTVGSVNLSSVVQTVTQAAQSIRDNVISFTVKEVSAGSAGASALLAQRLLKAMGYKGEDGKPLELDGEFGANTLWAVRCFQAENGLDVDGVCGPKTWGALLGSGA